jgi:hypothetical protein
MLFHNIDHASDVAFGSTKTFLFCDATPLNAVLQGDYQQAMMRARNANRLNKVVIVTLFWRRFVLVVFNITTNEVRLVADFSIWQEIGYGPGSNTLSSAYTRRWFDKYEAVFGGNAANYTWLHQPYILDFPRSNNGPAAVLAVHYELTGKPLAGETPGSVFLPHFRGVVVNAFISLFKELYLTRKLIQNTKRSRDLQWEYVNPAHRNQSEEQT